MSGLFAGSDAPAVPTLDAAQRTVVAHSRGPLLVLAGPGTGKTTTIVEAVVARLAASARSSTSDALPAHDVQPPVLVLTFGRAAADELRERIASRLGTGVLPTVSTFHAFSYALVREFAPADEFTSAPRLIDAADQDARLRELLTNAVAEGRVPWPPELDAAIGTQGLAEQVRQLLARAQLLGFDEVALRRAAQEAGMSTWAALADFLGEYLDVLDASGVFDYSELIHRAVQLLADPAVAKVLHQRYSAIYVDEYQDTDPAQVRLLQSLTNTDSVLVAVGDPDQSIYGFRGADVGGILRFREDFPAGKDVGAEVVVLSETRRFGVNIAKAAGRVIQRVGLGGLPAEIQREHRSPVCAKPDPGVVEVVTFDSSAAQASSVADRIRRARLTGAVGAWSDIAVIVRSAASQLPLLAHALESVGVPVDLTADDVPLHEHRAVATLLDVLAVAADPVELTISRTRALLQSPMVGVDPITYRRLGRLLRNALAEEAPTMPPSSDQAIRRAITDDDFYAQAVKRVGATVLVPVTVLRNVIGSARAEIDRGALVEAVLWAAWSATDWPQRLERAAKGQSAAARSANRDLDNVLALFAQAARADQAFGIARPVQNFLAEIVDRAISTVSNGDPIARDAVALLTAHGAKGLQWPMVFVVGVQEDSWPDLRSRPSLLIPDRLSEEGIGDPPRVSEALEAERRLFYVACTRAEQTLVLTAVSNAGDSPTSGEQPSRFLAEVAGDASTVTRSHEPGYQLSSLSTASMVAALRSNLEAPETSPALKSAAAQRLARLAADGVSAADPKRWWGLADWTRNDTHVRVADEPLRISGSSWSQLDRCSLAWFYEHEVKARSASNSSTAFGSVIHELADAVADGRIPAEIEVLTGHLKSVWPSLGFDSDWQQAAEFKAAEDAVVRFLNWHAQRGDVRVIGSELRFNSQIDIPGDSVSVTGSVDRLEIDAEGQLHIYDLKTQKKPETGKHLAAHRQLELYQLVANEGAFDEAIADHAPGLLDESEGRLPVADAALVLLRIPDKHTELPRVQVQGAVPVDVVKDELSEAVSIVRNEAFVPTVNEYCGFCNFRNVCPVQPESAEVAR